MRYFIADEIFEIEAGDVVMIPKGVIHNTSYGATETERLLINFPAELVNIPDISEAFNKKVIHLTERESFELTNIFKKLEAEKEKDDKYSKLLITQYVTEIIALLLRHDGEHIQKKLDGYTDIMQKAVNVRKGDTPEVLQKRVMEQAEWKILPLSTQKVCKNIIGNR